MFKNVSAKIEKLTDIAGRYINLDHAARWRKPALMIGTFGWAGRWAILGFLTYDLLGSVEAETLTPPPADTSAVQTTLAYAAAIGACMIIKWAGWTYGGLGYVHHRRKTNPLSL